MKRKKKIDLSMIWWIMWFIFMPNKFRQSRVRPKINTIVFHSMTKYVNSIFFCTWSWHEANICMSSSSPMFLTFRLIAKISSSMDINDSHNDNAKNIRIKQFIHSASISVFGYRVLCTFDRHSFVVVSLAL